jgi:hypothetical protein
MSLFPEKLRARTARSASRPARTFLRLTTLEDRTAPAVFGFNVTGSPPGALPLVNVTRNDGSLLARITAYDPAFRGGVNATTAELDGIPGTVEIVTGAGTGGGPHVKVFAVNKATGGTGVLSQFMAYDPAFRGGVNVAAGRVGSLATDAIVTGPGPGGGPHVRVFRPDGSIIGQFMAFNPASRTGVAIGPVMNGQFSVNALQGGAISRFGLNANGTFTSTVVNSGGAAGTNLFGPAVVAGVPAFTGPGGTVVTPGGVSANNTALAGGTAISPLTPLNTAAAIVGTPAAVTGANNANLPGTSFMGPVLPSTFGSNVLVGPNTPAVFFSPAGASTGTTPSPLTPFGGTAGVGGTFLPVGAFGGGVPSLATLSTFGPANFGPGFGLTNGSLTSSPFAPGTLRV